MSKTVDALPADNPQSSSEKVGELKACSSQVFYAIYIFGYDKCL